MIVPAARLAGAGGDQASAPAISVGERPPGREMRGDARRLILGLAGAMLVECGLLAVMLASPSAPPDEGAPPVAVTMVSEPAPVTPPAPPAPAAAAAVALQAVPVAQAAPAAVDDGVPPAMPDMPAEPAEPAEIPLLRALPRLRPREAPHLRRPATLPAAMPAAQAAVAAPPLTAPATAPAAAAAPRSAGGAGVDSLEGRLRAAVQAALHYPPAARMMGRTGRSRIAFIWRDSVAADVHVVSPSDLPAFDVAALDAVRDADYPKPPPELLHHTLTLAVWVDFKLSDD